MAHILVVEDEKDIQQLLNSFLVHAGYTVTVAGDGVSALSIIRERQFDLIILDIMLPKIDGFAVLEVIRQTSTMPVLMLTALRDEEYQLRGYDLKADDYMTKPFSIKILLKKIEAILRRSGGDVAEDCLAFKELRIIPSNRQVFLNEKEVILTQTEFEILYAILSAKGRVLTREILLEQIWDYDFMGDTRVVDTHIKNLRRKLGNNYIETIRGVGYRRVD